MKVCLIGVCGHVRQAMRVLRKRENVILCGIAPGSIQEGRVADFDPTIPFYEDYRVMLDEVKPDLAVVSPVFGLTGEVILACAQRRASVFSEKPVATTLSQLEQVERAVRENGIRFCAMHYLRYTPAFYEGARMVAEGAIGELRMITAQKSYRYGIRPQWYGERSLYGGTIPWVGIHAIDWIYHFSGKRFLTVRARSVGKNPEMAALCQFELEGDVMASMNLDYYRPDSAPTHGDDRIRCVGTEGVLEIRECRIDWMNGQTRQILEPVDAPELLTEFLDGKDPISPEEIFYLTRVALLTREAADTKQEIRIEG
ncbi:MAG: Gfo/Idh/MocA family oxidoreductase [Clostridia bacterium]|nr:Gfo/Idh/MocA family oxidoreductase [Clostridia bacterium]